VKYGAGKNSPASGRKKRSNQHIFLPNRKKLAVMHKEVFMFPEVIAEVKGFIDARNVSVEKFASQARVGERTMYRFLKGEPVSEKIFLKILQTVHGKNYKQTLNALREKYPDDESIKRLVLMYESKAKQNLVVDEFFRDFYTKNVDNYRLVSLLSNDEGVSKAEIQAQLGSKGLKGLEVLSLNGKVTDLGQGRYRLEKHRYGFFDGNTAKALTTLAISLYDPETFGTSDSQIGHMNGWTSEEGLKQIKQTLMEAIMKCLKIEANNLGNVPFSLATCMIKTQEETSDNDSSASSQELLA
jgi:hypothetical protein